MHEGKSIGTEPSLHITISCFQKNACVDFMEMLMSRAVLTAAERNVALRKGLPRDFLKYHGICNMPDEGEDEVSERVRYDREEEELYFYFTCRLAMPNSQPAYK